MTTYSDFSVDQVLHIQLAIHSYVCRVPELTTKCIDERESIQFPNGVEQSADKNSYYLDLFTFFTNVNAPTIEQGKVPTMQYTMLVFRKISLLHNGGFQLLDLIITKLKSHMTCQTSMHLIG